MEKKKLPLVDLLLLTVAIIWAFNFTAIKLALEEIPPIAFNTLRFIGSSIVLSIYYHFFIGDYSFIRKHFKRLLFLALTGNTILQIVFIYGINFTTAGNSSLMYSTVPMFVAIISVMAKIEVVKKVTWAGIILSFFGIILILSSSAKGLSFTVSSVRGDLLILVAAVCWSVFTVFAKPLIKETSILKVVVVTFVLGTFFLIPFAINDFMTMSWSSVSYQSWGLLVYSFLLANVFAYIIWFYAVSKVGNVQTAIFQNITPVLAVIIAAILLKETVSTLQVIGGLCIIGGVSLTRLTMVIKNNGRNNPKKS
ncbi:MAG: DMT family transporter [bacterium]|nr:DMT family transporter [bacterium]